MLEVAGLALWLGEPAKLGEVNAVCVPTIREALRLVECFVAHS